MNEIGKEMLKRDLLKFKTKEELVEMDMNMLNEVYNLQSKIDKAIEYIDKTQMGEGYKKELHDILKENK